MYLKAFPKYPTKIKKTNEGSLQIFDIVRKKHVNLTPEEWVRQHVLHYLVEDLKIDKVRVAVEKEFQYKSHSKRFDVMVYHNHRPKLLVECKAAHVSLDQSVADQIGRYNFVFESEFLLITNGMASMYFQRFEEKGYQSISKSEFEQTFS